MMKTRLRNLAVLAVCVAAIGSGSIGAAQSVRHDKMDARAARQDIIRLKADRRMAVRRHNWNKVHEDDRLIAADRHFIHKDIRKVHQAGM